MKNNQETPSQFDKLGMVAKLQDATQAYRFVKLAGGLKILSNLLNNDSNILIYFWQN